MSESDIVIAAAARTPIGRFRGAYAATPATELGAAAVRAAVARAGIDPAQIEQCIMGNVIAAGLGQAPARQAALHGGLPAAVGALTINKVCGSGLAAVMLAAALIRSGDAQAIVAGGMENMTRGPYLLPQARSGYRFGHGELLDATLHDGLWCAFEQQPMGAAAEWIARTYSISRAEQDAFALESQHRAAAAIDAGAFAAEIAPTTIAADEPPRRDTSAALLARLSPAFVADGSVTAGNAPGLSDGAAALVILGAQRAAELGLRPLARIVAAAQAAVEPHALFTAPVAAIRKLFARSGTTRDYYDLFEINEAFAAQVIANMRELEISHERLNVGGGAIALGHPLGASGARVLTTLIYALQRRGGGRGIAALCLGGGEAVAMAIEVA